MKEAVKVKKTGSPLKVGEKQEGSLRKSVDVKLKMKYFWRKNGKTR